MVNVVRIGDKRALARPQAAQHERNAIGQRHHDDPERRYRREAAGGTLREINCKPAQREPDHQAARVAKEHPCTRLPRETQVEDQEAGNGAAEYFAAGMRQEARGRDCA